MTVEIVSNEILSEITNAIFHITLDGEQIGFIHNFCCRERMDNDQSVSFINMFDDEAIIIHELSRLNQIAYAHEYHVPVISWHSKFTPNSLFDIGKSWPRSVVSERLILMRSLRYMYHWLYQVQNNKVVKQKTMYKFVEYVSKELAYQLTLCSNEFQAIQYGN